MLQDLKFLITLMHRERLKALLRISDHKKKIETGENKNNLEAKKKKKKKKKKK